MRKIFLALIISAFLTSGFITKDNDVFYKIGKSIDIYGRVYKEVTLNYVDPLNPEEFMIAGIEGMLSSLDPYTNFIEASNQKDIEIITKGKYGGIGASIGVRNNEITVLDLIEGYSAHRQGMRIGDIIVKINDLELNLDNYDKMGSVLNGSPGTSIKISVRRELNEDTIDFNLIREEIEVKNIPYFGFIPANSNNAYIKLSGFSQTAGEELKKAILKLKSEKEINYIVLDLRGNPGGLLDAAIDVAEKFIAKGQLVVTVKGRDTLNIKQYYSNEEPLVNKNVKITILIDEGTASASEIVAGALQDHDRAVIVGTTSFGKGLVQTVMPLPYNNTIKITTARYYTPSGRSIQKIDYSGKNKVFVTGTANTIKEFKTDHDRKVFSAGGILPDSVVEQINNKGLLRQLLAEGMFFRFATNYFNSNSSLNVLNLPDELILKEFFQYLKKQKFEYVSRSEKLIEQLKAAGAEENMGVAFNEQLLKIKAGISQFHLNEFDAIKNEIVNYIKEELFARSEGREGRIKQSIKNDRQLEVALNIQKDERLYKKFLRNLGQ